MSRILRNESTPAAKAIWQAVDNAAAKAPQWLKEHIEKAALAERETIDKGIRIALCLRKHENLRKAYERDGVNEDN